MKINLHCLSFLSFIQKIHKIPTYHWSKTIESGEKISWWNKCFHYFMLATIIGTQYCNVLSQGNSSEFSPIMSEEFGEHLTRDQRPFLHTESLQILQIHSSMTVLLLFSSPHSFSVGFRSRGTETAMVKIHFVLSDHFCVYFVCFGLLSCWKIKTWPL